MENIMIIFSHFFLYKTNNFICYFWCIYCKPQGLECTELDILLNYPAVRINPWPYIMIMLNHNIS